MNADNRRKRYNSAAGRPGHDGGRSIGLCTRYPTPGPRPTRVTHVPLVSGTDIRQAFCAVRMSYAWYYARISAVSAPPDLSGLERGGNAVATRIKVLRTPDPAF